MRTTLKRLAIHVLRAHVDVAVEAEQGSPGRRRPTPCCPAPVSATNPPLAHARASSAWPIALLILCAPVVRQVFALQEKSSAAGRRASPWPRTPAWRARRYA